MRIPETKLDEISGKTDIVDVVSEYTSLNRKGDRYWGCCPFHQEKTPSFSVTPGKNLYYCFGCGASGSVFSFLMNIEHMSFLESVEKLAQKAGVSLEGVDSNFSREDKEKKALIDLYQRVAGSYHYILTESSKGQMALDYIKERGFSQEIIDKFQVGYSPRDRRWLYQFLTKKNYHPQFLQASGLFSKKYPQSSFFSHRLMIPIINRSGQVIGFGGRLLEGEGPKYLNSSESVLFKKSQELFGLYQAKGAIRKEKAVILVEGYLDVMALHQGGVENVVAPLGTSFTPEQAKLLKRYTDKVLLLFDSDQAGQKATLKAAGLCEEAELIVEIIFMDQGKDPAEVMKKEGPEALKKILKYPINTVEYLVLMMREVSSAQESDVWWENIQKAFAYIKHIKSEIRKEEAIKNLSSGLDVSVDALINDFKRFSAGEKREYKKPKERGNPDRDNRIIQNKHDRFLMFSVLANPETFLLIRRYLLVEDLVDQEAREAFVTFEEAYRRGEMSFELLLSSLPDSNFKQQAVKKRAEGEFEVNPEQLIRDTINRIRLRSFEQKRNRVVKSISDVSESGDREVDIYQLLEEKKFLDSEIEKLKVRANGGTAE